MATTFKFDVDRMREDTFLRGWMPVHLARKAKVADMTVYRFFSGERQTPKTAAKLAKALGYSLRRYVISSRNGAAA